VDANLELGLPVDAREYSVAAQLLTDLGVRSVQLLTNNPAKVDALAEHGFGVTRIPLPPLPTPHNLRYLTAKRDRLGHQIDNLGGSSPRKQSPNGRVVPTSDPMSVAGERAG
jgi:3,4-dihydroxy 2-butanone 4-phosphate synthase/GTP cyclohydrolase II